MATTVSMEALNHVISLVHHEVEHHAEHKADEDPFKVAKELSISIICIVGGVVLAVMSEKLRTPGLLLVFFGAQTGMNMYMKAIFSTAVVATDPPGGEGPWLGFQASFFVTAMQQLGSFFIFFAVYGPAKLTGATSYKLKVLSSKMEVIAVLCFAVSFTLNIALNNFSLMLIPLTMNLIIRQCLPLSTYASQWILTKYTTGEGKPIKVLEISLMLVGVCMAGVCVWAKVSAAAEEAAAKGDEKSSGGEETGTVMIGVAVCVLSLFSGSVNLALAGVLGTSVKLDSAGTVVYNSIPATILLIPFILFMPHPVNWPGFGVSTDIEVAKQVWANSKSTFALAFSSSLASLVYNILQFGIVQYLSATHVAFAGNFNKAATLPLALAVGIDTLPGGKWGPIMIVAAMINICAFTAYNMISGGAGGHGGHGGGAPKEKEKEKEQLTKEPSDDSDDEDDDDDDTEEGCC